MPVLACNGWSVTTVEGLGSVKEGISPIQVIAQNIFAFVLIPLSVSIYSFLKYLQSSLVRHSGSQCGFCTPGVVMAANTLLQVDK